MKWRTPFLLPCGNKNGCSQRDRTMDHKETPTDSFHIGQAIKAELTRQGRSITWLAQQIGYTRENLYKIMRRKWIYTDVLFKICDALDYDFFKACSDWRNSPSYPKSVNQNSNP